jgi:hypothetical protein
MVWKHVGQDPSDWLVGSSHCSFIVDWVSSLLYIVFVGIPHRLVSPECVRIASLAIDCTEIEQGEERRAERQEEHDRETLACSPASKQARVTESL